MKDKSKDTALFCALIPICLVLAIFFAYTATTATKGIQPLSEEQIDHYVDVAESTWNKDSIHTDAGLQFNRTKESITVYSYNIFEEIVTVYFDGPTPEVVVKAPNINFTGCIIFFYTLASVAFAGSIAALVAVIKEARTKETAACKSIS